MMKFLFQEVVESKLSGADGMREIYGEGEEGVALEGVSAGPEGGGGGFCNITSVRDFFMLEMGKRGVCMGVWLPKIPAPGTTISKLPNFMRAVSKAVSRSFQEVTSVRTKSA